MGPDLALGVVGNSQIKFADEDAPALALLGVPLGDACLELAAGELPCVEGRRLFAGFCGEDLSSSLTVAAFCRRIPVIYVKNIRHTLTVQTLKIFNT